MERPSNSRRMRLLRKSCIAPCIILLLTLTACSRAIRYGMDSASQTEPEATVQPTLINPILKEPDWFVFLQRAGDKLVQYATKETLPDEYKLHYMAYIGDDTQLTEYKSCSKRAYCPVVEALLKAPGIKVNAKENSGYTPLHRAAMNGHTAVVEVLLKAPGIYLKAKNHQGNTPLETAQNELQTTINEEVKQRLQECIELLRKAEEH